MKAFFAMTAAVLMTVTMLFAALPGAGLAAEGKVTLAEMVKIKKAADEAAQSAKAQAEKAKTAEEKRLAKQLVKQAEINAEVAGDLLEAVKAGEEVSREEAQACAAIAKLVNKASSALAAGNADGAGDVLDRIVDLGSSLPTAANARAEMQRADGAGNKNTAPPVIGGKCKADEIDHRPYGPIYCLDSKTVAQNYLEFECSYNPFTGGRWISTGTSITKNPCPPNKRCQGGQCVLPVCLLGERKSLPVGTMYCEGNAVCQKYDDYECVLSPVEKWVKVKENNPTCNSCSSGEECIPAPQPHCADCIFKSRTECTVNVIASPNNLCIFMCIDQQVCIRKNGEIEVLISSSAYCSSTNKSK